MPESLESLRKQLYAAFKHRAILYYLIYDELQQEVGRDKAVAVMQRAIRRRGEQVGQRFAEFAPRNLESLCKAFVDGIPDDGCMFAPRVERLDSEQLDVVLTACPLRDAWQELGLDDDTVALMCHIAAAIDEGTFEGAGFRFTADTWTKAADGCCHLHIRPGVPAE